MGGGGLMDWELTNRGLMLQQVWHDGDPCLFSKTISAEHGFQIILQGTSLNELVTYSCTYKLSWILYARVIYVIFILWMSFTCKLLNSFCRCTIILVGFFSLVLVGFQSFHLPRFSVPCNKIYTHHFGSYKISKRTCFFPSLRYTINWWPWASQCNLTSRVIKAFHATTRKFCYPIQTIKPFHACPKLLHFNYRDLNLTVFK